VWAISSWLSVPQVSTLVCLASWCSLHVQMSLPAGSPPRGCVHRGACLRMSIYLSMSAERKMRGTCGYSMHSFLNHSARESAICRVIPQLLGKDRTAVGSCGSSVFVFRTPLFYFTLTQPFPACGENS